MNPAVSVNCFCPTSNELHRTRNEIGASGVSQTHVLQPLCEPSDGKKQRSDVGSPPVEMGIRQEIKALRNGRFSTFASWYSNVDTYPCTV